MLAGNGNLGQRLGLPAKPQVARDRIERGLGTTMFG